VGGEDGIKMTLWAKRQWAHSCNWRVL